MATVVVIDDSQYAAKQISKFLTKQGHEVVATGSDGNDGVELYKKHRPDLILLDITMPVKDGHVCMEEILEFDPQARILMVSAVKEPGAIMACLKRGARGFVEKPLKFSNKAFCEDFSGAIDDALAA